MAWGWAGMDATRELQVLDMHVVLESSNWCCAAVSTNNCNGKSILVFWTLDFPGAKVSDPLDKCRCSTLCHHLSAQQVVIKKVYLSLFFVTFRKLAGAWTLTEIWVHSKVHRWIGIVAFGLMVYKCFVDPAQEVEYMALPAETCQSTFEPTCQPAVSVKLNSTVQIWLDSINLHPLRFCIQLLGHLDEDCKCYFTQMKLSGILKRMFCERWSKVESIAPCRGHQLCRAIFNGNIWDCCLLCGLSS